MVGPESGSNDVIGRSENGGYWIIIGSSIVLRQFWIASIIVSRRVFGLDPRPRTEMRVDEAFDWFSY